MTNHTIKKFFNRIGHARLVRSKSIAIFFAAAVTIVLTAIGASAQIDPSTHSQYQLFNAGDCALIGDYGPCTPGTLPANAGWLPGPDIEVTAVNGDNTVLVRKGASEARMAYGEPVRSDYGVQMTTSTVVTLPVTSDYFLAHIAKATINAGLGGEVGVRLSRNGVVVQEWSSKNTNVPERIHGYDQEPLEHSGQEFDTIEFYATGGLVLVNANVSVIYLSMQGGTPVGGGSSGDEDQHLLVSSESTGEVLRFDEEGIFLSVAAPAGPAYPEGLAIGPDGNLYVVHYGGTEVLRFDSNGTPLGAFTSGRSTSTGVGLAFGPDGNLYVSVRSPSHSILRFDGTTGEFIDVFATGGLSSPDFFVFGPDGHLYVSSRGNHKVLRYNGTSGAFIDEFISTGLGGLSIPEGLVFNQEYLYVISRGTNNVLRYRRDTGAFVDEFITAGSGGLSGPFGLVIGPDGNFYVAGYFNDRVLRFDSSGAFMDIFASGGGLTRPTALIFENIPALPPSEESNSPPFADAGDDKTIHAGSSVDLDGSASSDPDEGDTLTYLWSIVSAPFGSGATLTDNTAVAPSFDTDIPGDYTVTLVVTDDAGESSPPATVTVTALNSAPLANAGPDQTITAGPSLTVSVTLDGSLSSDPDGDSLNYRWSNGATSATQIISLDSLGDHTFTLVVNDGFEDSDLDEVVITVTDGTRPDITCPADIVIEALDSSGVPATDAAIVAFLTAVSATDFWDSDVTITNNAPAVFAIGATVVTFTATDDEGNFSTCDATVTVRGAQGIKANVIPLLQGVKTGDKKIDKKLDDASKYINKSLGIGDKHVLWIDDLHVHSKHGHKVFDHEKKAVKKLMDLSKDKKNNDHDSDSDSDRRKLNVPDSVKEAAQEAIAKLVFADELLALTAIGEATDAFASASDPKIKKKIKRYLKKSQKALARGHQQLNRNRPDHAIDNFKKAWREAQKILNPKSGGGDDDDDSDD